MKEKQFFRYIVCLLSLLLFMISELDATENLALYRPVSVSSVGNFPTIAEFAVDGQSDTGWRSVRSWQEGRVDWLVVDLQGKCKLEAIELDWASSSDKPVFTQMRTSELLGSEQVEAWAKAYTVYISKDNIMWSEVYRTAEGKGGEVVIPLIPVEAGYVKVEITDRSHHECGVGLSEISVIGTCSVKRPAGDSWVIRRKEKVRPLSAIVSQDARVLELDTGWELQRADWAGSKGELLSRSGFDSSSWYNAIVPGTVLTSLVNEQVFSEPTIGRNNLEIPEALSRHSWWYRTELQVPGKWQQDTQKLWLEFDGINHCAEVWLNGKLLGNIEGAFTRGEFDITGKLAKGKKNILAVKIIPPSHPGVPLEKREDFWVYNGGALGKDSPAFLASIGWDWMAPVRDRGIGIWSDVRICRSGAVTIGDPQVVTDLPLPNILSADIIVTVPVENKTDKTQKAEVAIAFDGQKLLQQVNIPAMQTVDTVFSPSDFPQMVMKEPKLWWPAGYGQQPLYDLEITAEVDGQLSDICKMKFGVRELSYRGMKLIDGPKLTWNKEDVPEELEISVNGHPVLCRGGNWGYPEMLLRLTEQRLDAALRLHNEANMNMVRNWIGMSTTEKFYELCDKYGILIWNDFWLANPCDGPDPDNDRMFLANVSDTIKRYRNHPSIAIWCGRNEGLPPENLDNNMRELCGELDGTRYYQSHSSDIGVNGGGPYKYMPVDKYFTDINHGFKTEVGMPSVPEADTIRRMLGNNDPWPIDGRWAYHDFCPMGNQYREEFTKAIADKFGEADGIDDYCQKAQFINYDGYRAIFEGANHKIWNDCSGVLLWMSHPAWPSMVWQVYDYWYGTYGSYFGAKKANEPVHIQFCPADDTVELINHTRDTVGGNALVRIFDLGGKVLFNESTSVAGAKDSMTTILKVSWPETLPKAWILNLQYRDNEGRLVSDNTYWQAKADKDLQLLNVMKPAEVKTSVTYNNSKSGDSEAVVELENTSDAVALMLNLKLAGAGGKAILPAYYSDNYFSIMPGESKTVRIVYDSLENSTGLKVNVSGWNIN